MLRIRARHNKPGASLLATGLCCTYRKAATAATEEMRSIFEGNLRVFIGFAEKSGSPFFVLKEVERIVENRVSGAKTVPRMLNKLFFDIK